MLISEETWCRIIAVQTELPGVFNKIEFPLSNAGANVIMGALSNNTYGYRRF
ncbi:MAG: hypothetical protein JJ891_13150 [Rhizobiaceae bacterium]|jgi:hypothetical protein|nr:hypothetical protein [Rhizobiaceae bacterium]